MQQNFYFVALFFNPASYCSSISSGVPGDLIRSDLLRPFPFPLFTVVQLVGFGSWLDGHPAVLCFVCCVVSAGLYSRPQAVFLPAGAAAPVPPASAGARQDAPNKKDLPGMSLGDFHLRNFLMMIIIAMIIITIPAIILLAIVGKI